MRFIIVIVLATMLILATVPSVMADRSEDKPIPPGQLKKITFVHYAKPDGHPTKPDKPGKSDKTTDNKDYKLMGIVIPDTMTFYINANSAPAGTTNEIIAAFDIWDGATSVELFSNTFYETSSTGANYEDNMNTVSWAYLDDGIIAQASVWYIDYRHPKTPDVIVQADIVFNNSLSWGIDLDGEGDSYSLTEAYDIRNIATHEVGHVVGLADLYESDHAPLTMYGYGDVEETQKISLEAGDVAGAQALYGAP